MTVVRREARLLRPSSRLPMPSETVLAVSNSNLKIGKILCPPRSGQTQGRAGGPVVPMPALRGQGGGGPAGVLELSMRADAGAKGVSLHALFDARDPLCGHGAETARRDVEGRGFGRQVGREGGGREGGREGDVQGKMCTWPE